MNMPTGWIELTLYQSGEPLYVLVSSITAVHDTCDGQYAVLDTERDQWSVRESAREVIRRILKAETEGKK